MAAVEIAESLISQLANGLQGIAPDQNGIAFSDPELSAVPSVAQFGGRGEILGFSSAEFAADGILFHLLVPGTRTPQHGNVSRALAGPA